MLRILFVFFAVVLTVHLVGTGDAVRALQTLFEEPVKTVDAAAERLVACPPGDVIALEPIRSPPSARTESVQTRAPALHLAGPDADIALPPTIDEFTGEQEEASLEYRFAEIRRRAEEFLSR